MNDYISFHNGFHVWQSNKVEPPKMRRKKRIKWAQIYHEIIITNEYLLVKFSSSIPIFKSNFKLFGWYNHIMYDHISSHYYSYFWFLSNWCQQESEYNRSPILSTFFFLKQPLFYLLSYNVGSILFFLIQNWNIYGRFYFWWSAKKIVIIYY